MHAMSRPLCKYVKQGEFTHQELMDGDSKPLPPGAERLEVLAHWFEDVQEYVITHLIESQPDL